MKKHVFYILWCLFQIGIFLLGFFLQKTNKDLSLLNRLQYSVYISRGAGLCLAITPSMLILPLCRRTITLLRRFIPWTNSIFPDFSLLFHKLCAYTILFWGIVHMSFHYVNFYGVETILKLTSMYNLHYTFFSGITGHMMMISLFFITIFSGIYFRRFYFEIFWYTHHFFLLFMMMYPFHGIGCFVKTDKDQCLPYYSVVFFVPFSLLYFVERILRESQKSVKIDSVEFMDDIFKIKVLKTKEYQAGQYFLVKCIKVNKLQWHPFTVSSSPYEKHIEFTIRCSGDWTENLRDILLKNKQDLPFIKIDGPFGSPIDTICNYDTSVLVASGIGITPYISVLKYLIRKTRYKPFITKKIDLIWVNRDIKNFEWFNEDLEYIKKNCINVKIQFHLYLTEKITSPEQISLIYNNNLEYLNHVYKTSIPIFYGRPDFKKFFHNYLNENTQYKVGCFVCSSKAVEVAVRDSCNFYSNKDVGFIFKTEKFV